MDIILALLSVGIVLVAVRFGYTLGYDKARAEYGPRKDPD